jgi:rubredoxin
MIADWESLAKKICSASPENLLLRQCMLKMSARKSFFALEEEPLYWVLSEIIYKDEGTLEKRSATDLYGIFLEKARAMKIEDFSERYKNPGSLGRRLSHLRPELEREFTMAVSSLRQGVKVYSFGPLEEEDKSEMDRYECSGCGYTYDPEMGDPGKGIPAGRSFEDVSDNWVCPGCGAPKSKRADAESYPPGEIIPADIEEFKAARTKKLPT